MFIKKDFKPAILFSIAVISMAGGLYFIFDSFISTTGEEIVKAWYYGEVVNLQEGQILPAIAKNQNLFEKSPFIKSVVLIDYKDSEKSLFSVGDKNDSYKKIDLNRVISNKNDLVSFRSGFLSHQVFVKLPGKNNLMIIYDITSQFMMWSYFFAVAVSVVFSIYLIYVTMLVTRHERKKREDLRHDLIKRLAHDVNSPLLAVSGISLKIKKMDIDLHNQIEQATESIRRLFAQTDKVDKKIASENSKIIHAIDEDLEMIPLIPILKDFIYQKRSELAGVTNISLEFESPTAAFGVFVKINLDDFKRHLTNIVKNAIEAIYKSEKTNKSIKINVSQIEDSVKISISDNGCGIPQDQIVNIGKKGMSLGKSDGKGLGLHFAFQSVKYWKGKIDIDSSVGVGTAINISLPKHNQPDWYLSEVPDFGNKKIVIVDDDPSMIDIWRSKFLYSNIQEFNSAKKFQEWFNSHGQFQDELVFIFDYHLEDDNTGLQIIDKFGISKESILATSAYLDNRVIGMAKSLNVKLIPKVLI
ncbi:MAG: sensor histidine kinase [Bdellovibrio sp.]